MDAETIIRHEAKRFSIAIENYEGQYNGALDFKSDLTTALYDYYESVDRLIFLYEVAKQIDEVYERHLLGCQYKDNPEKCPTNLYYSKCKYFTEQEIRELNPTLDFTILRPNVNVDLIKENLVLLDDFPEAAKKYQSALDKFNESRFDRNLLDDLRLSFELVMRQVLNNSKSLENQLEPLGVFLKQAETSKEVTNMYRVLIDCYTKYQNNHVKHNDAIKEDEVDLLINLTSSFIRFLINKK